jgi:uncharacterized repeat protein (TIGR03803 family)
VAHPEQRRGWISRVARRAASAALALVVAVVLAVAAIHSARAQTYTENVLYSFTGTPDGASSNAGLVRDEKGNLYGTTGGGGTFYIGTVFKLSTSGKETVRYRFQENPDGAEPDAGLIRDERGNFYGTTPFGGNDTCVFKSCGTVFKLRRGQETVLYKFCSKTNCADGELPYAGVILGANGNLYGTTEYGGGTGCNGYGCGTVFKLDLTGKEAVLYSFTGGTDGAEPRGDLIRDHKDNLYGTTLYGGAFSACYSGCGVVFKLDTTGKETVLYSFNGEDGANPEAGLLVDSAGNLYGTTFNGGSSGTGCGGDGCGTVFELDTTGKETVLYNFTGTTGTGSHPVAGLIRDAAGNLYGTAAWGGGIGCVDYSGCGMAFKLKKSGEMIVLYGFTGGSDGGLPYGSLVRDVKGNLYSTTAIGGDLNCNAPNGCGVVFRLTP